MRHLYRTKKRRTGTIAGIAVFIAVIAVFFVLLTGAGNSAGAQGEEQLTAALRRAAVTCYAAEGRYPPSLSYLCEHYGVHIDSNTYSVRYDVFGSNMMPDIAVTQKEVG